MDLVTLDLRMPGLDGMEVPHQIKGIDRSVEVLIVTACPRRGVLIELRDSGLGLADEVLGDVRRSPSLGGTLPPQRLGLGLEVATRPGACLEVSGGSLGLTARVLVPEVREVSLGPV
jgi:hypothetical protein